MKRSITPSDFRLLFIGATQLPCRACDRSLKSGTGYIALEAERQVAFGPVCVRRIDDRPNTLIPNLTPKFTLELREADEPKGKAYSVFTSLARKPASDFEGRQVAAAEFVLMRHELQRRGFRNTGHNEALNAFAQKIFASGIMALDAADMIKLRAIYKDINSGWGTRDATDERSRLCLMVDEEITRVRASFRKRGPLAAKLASIQDQLHRTYSLSTKQIHLIISASGNTGIPSRLPTSLDLRDPYARKAAAPAKTLETV